MPKIAMIALMSAGTISLATASYVLGRYGWPLTFRGSKAGAHEASMPSSNPDRRSSRSWFARFGTIGGNQSHTPPSSGNLAFDEYRAQSLKRLEDEKVEFSKFLERLRRAKDRQEFDDFLRHRQTASAADDGAAV